jgi:hypothetical protein
MTSSRTTLFKLGVLSIALQEFSNGTNEIAHLLCFAVGHVVVHMHDDSVGRR